MPLRPVIQKLEDVEEAHRSLYEPEVDKDGKPTGFYIVSISKENGYELHNSEKLMGALSGEREANKALKSELAKFEGIDPSKIASLTQENEQLKASNPDNKKIEDLVEERVAPYKSEIAKQLDVYKSEAAAQLAEKDELIQKREKQLNQHLVSDYALRVADKIAVSPSLVAMKLQQQLRADLDGDEAKVVILDANGNPRFSKENFSQPASEEEWIEDIRKMPELAPLIKGNGNPGTNSPQTNSSSPFKATPSFSDAKTADEKKAAIRAKVAARNGG